MTVAETQDIFIRALCVWREMRGECDDARRGCYWVICNRSLDPRGRWPKTVYGVVTQRYQFTSFNINDPNANLFPREGSGDWLAWKEICALCDDPGADPVDGANMYEAVPVGQSKPGWAFSARLVKQIGNTRFYKL